MLSKISLPTALVVIAGIAAVITCAALKIDVTYLGAIAAALIGLAGAMQKLFKDDDDDKTPPPPVGPSAVFAALVLMLVGCTPQAQSALAEGGAELALCALANLNLPAEQMLLKCGPKTLEDRERLLRIFGEARAQAAAEAAVAAERAREETMRAAVAGAVGVCR